MSVLRSRIHPPVDLVIRGGTLVSPAGLSPSGLAIQDGVIVAAADEGLLPPSKETIDATGLYTLPGVIDAHGLFRDPGNTEDGDWQTGSAAAACGGVPTFFDMPSPTPPVDNASNFRLKDAL